MTLPYPSYEQVHNARMILRNISYQHWVHDDFLTWRWWLLVVLTLLPWLLWWVIVDKNRLREILLYGMIMSCLSIMMDNIGTDLLFWEYPDKLFQMVPPLFPADISLIPTCMMSCYQWASTWRNFFAISIVFALAVSFIAEPTFQLLNLYKPLVWNSFYSFPIWTLMALFGRFIVLKTSPKERL